MLISFLNTLLPEHHQIADLQYTKNEYQGITPTDRKAIFDLNCISDRGERFIVELQKVGVFQRMFDIAQLSQFSPEERTAYEDRLKHYRDLKNATDTARLEGTEEGFELGLKKGKELGLEEGKQLGKQEGLEEGKRETARRMLGKDMTVELVAELTGLAVEQVRAL